MQEDAECMLWDEVYIGKYALLEYTSIILTQT